MKFFRVSAALAAFVPVIAVVAGCAAASASPPTPTTSGYPLHAQPPSDANSRPPRLTVGTSYSDTQLILPWFLNDIIDLVNYR